MIIVAWIVQAVGILGSAGFLVVYGVGVVRYAAPLTKVESAARQLLVSLPIALLALLTPGAVYTLLGHSNILFSSLPTVAGKAVAVALLWCPWRLYFRARAEARRDAVRR